MTVRYRDGKVTVELDGGMERFVRRALDGSMSGAVAAMEEPLEAVAAKARSDWYGPDGVTRRTGISGNIQVVTTVDVTRRRVVVAMGALDSRKSTSKAGRTGPLPWFIFRSRKSGMSPKQFRYLKRIGKLPPKQFLFPRFIRAPGQRAIKGVAQHVASRIAQAVRQGR